MVVGHSQELLGQELPVSYEAEKPTTIYQLQMVQEVNPMVARGSVDIKSLYTHHHSYDVCKLQLQFRLVWHRTLATLIERFLLLLYPQR